MAVLFPKQLLGHPLTLEFLMHQRILRRLRLTGSGVNNWRIKTPFKFGIIELRWQKSTDFLSFSLLDYFLDCPDAQPSAGADLSDGELRIKAQAKDIFNGTHWNPRGGHGSVLKMNKQLPKEVERSIRWRGFCLNVNTHTGIVNTDTGNRVKVFTFNQYECSRCSGISVHVRPVQVFTLRQNMHQAIEKVNWYSQRWNIETFHKILKSKIGCGLNLM